MLPKGRVGVASCQVAEHCRDPVRLAIAVYTAVAHLAGALDRPVWMLNRSDSCWRWLRDRDDTLCYPSMTIFRQHQ